LIYRLLSLCAVLFSVPFPELILDQLIFQVE